MTSGLVGASHCRMGDKHFSSEFRPVRVAVLTVSDTRTVDTDKSGAVLLDRVQAAGHEVAARQIVKDVVDELVVQLRTWIADPGVDVVIATGGTGLTGRDVTPEAMDVVCDKLIPGFGELFRFLSYDTIGTSTMQSRAMAGISNGTYIFAIPGSTGACKDAWDKILKAQLDSRTKPCNLVELMPRLTE